MPPGTLRRALLYPDTDRPVADDRALADAAGRCGLAPSRRAASMRRTNGQHPLRRREAAARLRPPPYRTRPTSPSWTRRPRPWTNSARRQMMEFFRTDLAETTILNVAHRPGPRGVPRRRDQPDPRRCRPCGHARPPLSAPAPALAEIRPRRRGPAGLSGAILRLAALALAVRGEAAPFKRGA